MEPESIFKNPFLDYNANAYSSLEVYNYWYSPFNTVISGVQENDLYMDTMPYLISGHRGSGKTMLLKYLSYFTQKIVAKNSDGILEFLNNKKMLGVYLRLDISAIMNMNSIEVVDNLTWKRVFSDYFDVCTLSAIIDIIDDLVIEKIVNLEELNEKFFPGFKLLFRVKSINNIEDIRSLTLDMIYEINEFREKIYYIEDLKYTPKILFGENIIFNLVELMKKSFAKLENVNFSILIDEFENYNYWQQNHIMNMMKFINSSSGRSTTFRVGYRIGGLWQTNTLNSDEFIKVDNDYKEIVLNSYKSNNSGDLKEYKMFLKKIAENRLKQIDYFRVNQLTDIENFLGKREDFIIESKDVVKGRDDHFKLLKHPNLNNEVISMIRNPENHLQELVNIFLVNKGLGKGGMTPKEVKEAMEDYNSSVKNELSNRYKHYYSDKYKYAALVLLCHIYKKEKSYYSFNTFVYLSTGSVRSFITLCRETFSLAYFKEKENLLKGKIINRRIQSAAAHDISQRELEMIKPISEVGGKLYSIVLGLGNLFRKYHEDEGIKYPETNQFAFDYNLSLEDELLVKKALVWSVFIKKPNDQQITFFERKGSVYTINKMYAPYFNITYRTRGGKNVVIRNAIELKFLIANSKYERISDKSVSEINMDSITEKDSPIQLTLFGDDYDF